MTFKNQKEMFDWIWENRPHESELTGEPLLSKKHFKWHWQFLHVLPKGSYPKFKLDPRNIMLALPDEHDHQNQYQAFHNRKSELKTIYYRLYYNKKF